ncbi:MAG: hypothetical protein WCQ44_07540 [Opitutaceae bacterium]
MGELVDAIDANWPSATKKDPRVKVTAPVHWSGVGLGATVRSLNDAQFLAVAEEPASGARDV